MERKENAQTATSTDITFTEELLEKIKDFAEENFCKDESEQFYVDDPEFAVTNPWYDHSGRYTLDDMVAVREWGLPVLLNYCIGALAIMQKQETSKTK